MDLPARLCLLMLMLLLTSSLFGQGQPSVYFKNITISDGLSNNEVKQITQDSLGFIWFATGSALDRYDGYTIKKFNPQLAHDYNRDMLTWRPLKMLWDQKQRLYIGSDFNGLQVYDVLKDSVWLFTTENSAISGNAVFKILNSRSGLIYLGTEKGLCIFDFSTKSFTSFADYSERVYAIAEDDLGYIWFSDEKKGLIKFDPVTLAFQPFKGQSSPGSIAPEDQIYDLNYYDDGLLYVASEQGIWAIDVKSNFLERIMGPDLAPSAFSCVLRDDAGNIWAGSYNHGLFHYDRASHQITNLKHNLLDHTSLISNKVSCLYQGARGNIWIGTYGDGISVVKPDFQRIKVHRQLDHAPMSMGLNDVKQLVRGIDSTIWLALENGVTRLDSKMNEMTFYDFRKFTPCSNNISHVTADNQGDLYLTTNCGIVKWSPRHPRHVEVLEPGDSLFPRGNFLALQYEDEKLYVSTTSSDASRGLWVYDLQTRQSKKYQHSEEANTISSNNATRIHFSKNGLAWIGTWDDLNVLEQDLFTRVETLITDSTCLKGGSTIWAIEEDHQGYIWYGRLDEGGLLIFDPATSQYRCFDLRDQLYNNSVTSIMQDYNYDIWLGTYFGIAKLKYPKNVWEDPLEIQSFTVKDGLPVNTIWNGIASEDRRILYFGSTDGLVEILPEKIKTVSIIPPLRFTDFKLLNKRKKVVPDYPDWETSSIVHLPHHQNAFTVEFAGLNFLDNEWNEYKVLFGDDTNDHWLDIGRQHSATFSNLNPGKYSLRVKVKSRNSAWSAVEKMDFQINPPYWKSPWFFAGLATILLFLAYQLHHYRLSRVIEIQGIRNKIAADLHDDIGTTLSNIEILSHLSTQQLKDPDKIESYIKEIRSQAHKSNQSLHDIVWSINPENDKIDQILLQLSRLAIEMLEPMGIRIKLKQDILRSSILIKSEKRKDIFLAFKESVSNIARHSKTDSVLIELQASNKILTMTITDYGVGLKDGAFDKGNGLGNIKQRMEKWEGSAAFQSTGEGLQLTLVVPIP